MRTVIFFGLIMIAKPLRHLAGMSLEPNSVIMFQAFILLLAIFSDLIDLSSKFKNK